MTSGNNKRLGTAFERQVCIELAKRGYWVHFIAPDNRGAQPFDIIAVRHGIAQAIECKTLSYSERYFPLSRLEENQRFAFDRWMACGNSVPVILVEYGAEIYTLPYTELKAKGKIDMKRATAWEVCRG